MRELDIGVIGFGEVGSTFSRALTEAGAQVTAYDILLDDPSRADEMGRRILDTGSETGTFEEVVKNSAYLLSTVVTQVAIDVAERCAPLLNPGQVYVDLNSTSPSVKVEIGEIIEGSGADFVEGAILGAIASSGAGTKILTCGDRGQEAADTLSNYGLNVHFYSGIIGRASTFKMLRSVFSKGVEALLLEMMVAGRRAGIEGDLWTYITEYMDSRPFLEIGSNWITSHATAHVRRYHEIVQITETLRELGVEPRITEGTLAYFRQSMDIGMAEAFDERPGSIDEVIKFIEERTK
ncbi:MAG: NAD(P)-binding domain-containing protein [Candidatus Bathyarchaeota archaeon]